MSDKEKDVIFEAERQKKLNRGITIGKCYRFYLDTFVGQFLIGANDQIELVKGSMVVGRVVNVEDGWVYLENDICINLNSNRVVLIMSIELKEEEIFFKSPKFYVKTLGSDK